MTASCSTELDKQSYVPFVQTGAKHRKTPSGIEFVEVSGDEKATREWIGADVDLRWSQGVPGIHAVGIKTDAGTIILK